MAENQPGNAGHNRQHNRPAWPYPNIITMTAHPCGQWVKKINGKLHYFGVVTDPDAALARWNSVGEDLRAGRVPRDQVPDPDALNLRDLASLYDASLEARAKAKRISARHVEDVAASMILLLRFFGAARLVTDLPVADWSRFAAHLRERFNTTTMGNHVGRIRSAFKWAYESEYLDRPMRFGPEFKKESGRRVKRLYAAEHCRVLLAEAKEPLRTMILLGLNGGYGNTDCSSLLIEQVRVGFIDEPRGKTGMPRCVPLWPETAAGIGMAASRPRQPMKPAYAAHVFLTKRGQPFVSRVHQRDGVSQQFTKLTKAAGVPMLGFYTLRRTYRTVADSYGDQRAADVIMGEATPGMASRYVMDVDRSRLIAVANHVASWLGVSGISEKRDD